ncbi:hypothetical protein EV715DRAFT_297252 [Schizophyllum commune]
MELQPDRVQLDHHPEFPGAFRGRPGFVTRHKSLHTRLPPRLLSTMRFRRRKRRFYSWSVGTNLAVTRSLLAPVTRPTDLILPDDIGLSRLGPRVPSKATCSSRTPSGVHSRPFAPTYDSLLELVHDAGVGVADDDEGERRARPVGAEYQVLGGGRRATGGERAAYETAAQFLSDRDDAQRRPRKRDVEPEYQVDLSASGRLSARAQRSRSPDAPTSTRMCDDYARSSTPTAA